MYLQVCGLQYDEGLEAATATLAQNIDLQKDGKEKEEGDKLRARPPRPVSGTYFIVLSFL